MDVQMGGSLLAGVSHLDLTKNAITLTLCQFKSLV